MDEAITVFGFDVGTKCIGAAVGNTVVKTARPLGVLEVFDRGISWPTLDRWIRDWQPARLVVGDPVTLNDRDQPIRIRARAVAIALQHRYKLQVEQVDERFSSIEAAKRFAAGRASGMYRREQGVTMLDAMAAVVILERWFNEPSARTILPPDLEY